MGENVLMESKTAGKAALKLVSPAESIVTSFVKLAAAVFVSIDPLCRLLIVIPIQPSVDEQSQSVGTRRVFRRNVNTVRRRSIGEGSRSVDFDQPISR